jgi:hypothetical protein
VCGALKLVGMHRKTWLMHLFTEPAPLFLARYQVYETLKASAACYTVTERHWLPPAGPD